MRILLWHVHGSWTTAFVQGQHEYVVPVLPDRGPDGVGRARTWDWPDSVSELAPEDLRSQPFDVVVLQRPHELDLVRRWTGRRPGIDLPAVYLEHNTPEASAVPAASPARRPPGHPDRARDPLQPALLGQRRGAHHRDRARHHRPRSPVHRRARGAVPSWSTSPAGGAGWSAPTW